MALEAPREGHAPGDRSRDHPGVERRRSSAAPPPVPVAAGSAPPFGQPSFPRAQKPSGDLGRSRYSVLLSTGTQCYFVPVPSNTEYCERKGGPDGQADDRDAQGHSGGHRSGAPRQQPAYGYEITTRIRDHGFTDIAEGTIYALLVRIEQKTSRRREGSRARRGRPARCTP
ncbi:PadR family transcriptional regulator [Vibrio alginolyticus]